MGYGIRSNKEFTMKVTTRKFDVIEHLDSPEMIREYLQATLEKRSADLLKVALGNVARAKGMTDIAKATKLSRQHLYRALSENGSLQFDTIVNGFAGP
jgi:probable addiction module antidote protein